MRSFQRVSSGAKWGDRDAIKSLIGSYIPLAYNIVGCALTGYQDIDRLVQAAITEAFRADAIRQPPPASARFIAHMARSLQESRVVDRPLRPRPVCGGLAATAGWDRKSATACRNRLAANCRRDPKLSRLHPYV